jgi:hypothetical protein
MDRTDLTLLLSGIDLRSVKRRKRHTLRISAHASPESPAS